MQFAFFLTFLVGQRLSELFIASRNGKWLLAKGAVEYGREHYGFIVALHTLFILSLIAEYSWHGAPVADPVFLGIFLVLLLFKYWIISSLGNYWNTRIYRVPGFAGIKSGPYRFLRHPNYVEVVGEIAVIPLIFHLYLTAIVFTLLNAVMLTVRISAENRAWKEPLS